MHCTQRKGMFTWVYALVNRPNHSRNMNVVDDKDLFFRNVLCLYVKMMIVYIYQEYVIDELF